MMKMEMEREQCAEYFNSLLEKNPEAEGTSEESLANHRRDNASQTGICTGKGHCQSMRCTCNVIQCDEDCLAQTATRAASFDKQLFYCFNVE